MQEIAQKTSEQFTQATKPVYMTSTIVHELLYHFVKSDHNSLRTGPKQMFCSCGLNLSLISRPLNEI